MLSTRQSLRRSTRITNSSLVPKGQRWRSRTTSGSSQESTAGEKSSPSESTGSSDNEAHSSTVLDEAIDTSDEEADSIPDLDDKGAEADTGEICEVHMYQVRYDSRGERIVLQVGSSSELQWENNPSREAALVVTKFYSVSKQLESTRLSIQSPYIKQALRDVIGSYPGVNFKTKGPLYIFDQPRCLFHYYADLEAYATASQDENMQKHVRFCLRYVDKLLREEISGFKNMIENNTVSPGLEHRHLWMAFKPGTLLYQNLNGTDVVRRLLEFRLEEESDLPDVWVVRYHTIACDGYAFGIVGATIRIPSYEGCKPLNQLKIFPLEYHVDQKRIKDELVARGRRWVSLCGVHHKLYECRTECSQGDPASKPQTATKLERVIVDCKEFYLSVDPRPPRFIPGLKTFSIQTKDHLNLTDEQLLICGSAMPTYFLISKQWRLVDVTGLRDITFNTTAFDRLVIPQEQKDLISSLIQPPGLEAALFDDLIEGKGKGLIFLLHGPPGVGKTFTAESISEYTQRPLYNIGCCDLGGPPPVVEKTLRTSLRIATKWNAIVLLDEADVFMEERSTNELARNELVSVLLRALEYFEGIMFLTTNRVESLDPAFKSRIHLSIAYPSFSTESRLQLWKTFISHGSPKGARYKWLDEKFLKRISKEEVNGRQIKNVVSMAYTRAKNGKRALVSNDIILGLNALTTFEADFNQRTGKSLQKEKAEFTENSSSKRRKVA